LKKQANNIISDVWPHHYTTAFLWFD